MKKFFEKHDLFKIASILVLISVIFTWVLKYSYFTTGELTTEEINRLGIFDLTTYGLLGLYYFTVAIVFVFVVAGFYKVVGSIPAYQTITSRIARKFEGKEKVLVAVSILVFAILASVVSEYLVLLAFIPFAITIMSKLKLDKVTALSATFGGILVGILGATYSTKIVGYLVDSSVGVGVQYGYELIAVIILFAIAYILLTYLTFVRMNKKINDPVVDMFANNKETTKPVVKTDEPVKVEAKKVETKKEERKPNKKYNNKKNNKKTALLAKDAGEVKSVKVRKVSVIPMIIILAIMFVIIVLAFINWENAIGTTFFADLHKSITEATVFDVPIFKYILGNYFNAFGAWDLFGASSLLLIVLVIIKIVYRVNLDDLLDRFGEGLKLINKTILIMLIVYLVLEINVIFPTIPVIVKWIVGLGNNFASWFAGGLFASLFTVDFQYSMSLVGSYYASLSDANIAALALQTSYGLISFIAPSSLVLMIGLSMLDVKYKDWMKHIWKFACALLVIILIVLAIIKYV